MKSRTQPGRGALQRRSLVSRLTFGISATVFGTGVLVLLIASGHAYSIASDDLERTVEQAANQWAGWLKERARSEEAPIEPPPRPRSAPAYSDEGMILELWVFDGWGQCLYPGPEPVPESVRREAASLIETPAPVQTIGSAANGFRLCRTVDVGDERVGALLVQGDRQPMLARFIEQVGWGLASVLVLALMAGLLSLRWLDRNLVRPLDTMLRLDRESIRGEGGPHLVPPEGIPDDELGEIMRSRNALLRQLARTDNEDRARGRRLSEYRRWLNRRGFDLEVRVRDTTRMVLKAQERLLQSEKLAAIGKLASGIAHEINNPLAAIAGHAEDLRELAQEPALADRPEFRDFPESLRVIEEQAYRCKTILQRLLNFARQADVAVEPIDLDVLLRDCLALVAVQARQQGVSLGSEWAPDFGDFKTDRVHLQQVVINLLDNAIDASPEGGRVTLRAHRTETHVQISVTDVGVGIDPNIRSRVFDPFFTTKPVGQGTGMGLAICYGVVRRLGGVIELESEPGVGTEFTVTLPIESVTVSEEAPSRPIRDAAASMGGGGT